MGFTHNVSGVSRFIQCLPNYLSIHIVVNTRPTFDLKWYSWCHWSRHCVKATPSEGLLWDLRGFGVRVFDHINKFPQLFDFESARPEDLFITEVRVYFASVRDVSEWLQVCTMSVSIESVLHPLIHGKSSNSKALLRTSSKDLGYVNMAFTS